MLQPQLFLPVLLFFVCHSGCQGCQNLKITLRRDLDQPIVYVRERRGTHHNYNSKTDKVVVNGGIVGVTNHGPRVNLTVEPRAAPQDAPNARLMNVLTPIFLFIRVRKLTLVVDR